MNTQVEAAAQSVLIVLGIDTDNKPHASKFGIADRDLVLRAAGLMAYRVLELSPDDLGKLKAPVPDGKIFATGKGFVPFVRRELYDQLAALLGTTAELTVPPPVATAVKTAPLKTAAGKPDRAAAPALKAPRSELAVGSTVLARDDDNECWYEAVVVSVADDDTNVLRLRWRDYPQERQFTMHRARVGVVGPGGR